MEKMNREIMTIRISKELKEQATKEAKRNGKKLSEWVKDLMKKELWAKETRL